MHLGRPRSHGHECDCRLVRSGPFQNPVGREVAFTQGYGKNPANWSRVSPKFGWYGKVNQKSGRFTNVPFHSRVNRKRQVQYRSTFRNCWVSTGTRKCISLTKVVTLSQYIRETLFLLVFLFILINKLLNFNFSEPPNSFFKILLPMLFQNFVNHKLSPFRRWSMNIVNCLEIFCIHFCVFGGTEKLQILFLGCLKKSQFSWPTRRSVNSINKLLVYKLQVSN